MISLCLCLCFSLSKRSLYSFMRIWRRYSLSPALFCVLLLSLIGSLSLADAVTGSQHVMAASPYAFTRTPSLALYSGRDLHRPLHCQSVSNPIHCYGPVQMRAAYSIQPLLDKGIMGQGSSVVIIDAFDAPHLNHDLTLFDNYFHLPAATLNVYKPDGVPPFDGQNSDQANWSGETTLDVEWVHAIAPSATIQLVLAKTGSDDNLLRALSFAVKQNLGDTLSMSFGENENCLNPAKAPLWHALFYKATEEGMTLFSASGDDGASEYTCDSARVIRVVSAPANDPLVTGVGGTTLDADPATGAYHHETVWNDTGVHAGSGGGYSKLKRRPYYQDQSGPHGASRGVPDVAYSAALSAGVVIIWSDGVGGADAAYVNGGTSAGTPQWAALAALGVQLRGRRLGLINPALYALGRSAHYHSLFHDITSGNNTVPLLDKKHHLIVLNGYRADGGWSAVTGWGTPIASQLLPALVACLNAHSADYTNQLATLK